MPKGTKAPVDIRLKTADIRQYPKISAHALANFRGFC